MDLSFFDNRPSFGQYGEIAYPDQKGFPLHVFFDLLEDYIHLPVKYGESLKPPLCGRDSEFSTLQLFLAIFYLSNELRTLDPT